MREEDDIKEENGAEEQSDTPWYEFLYNPLTWPNGLNIVAPIYQWGVDIIGHQLGNEKPMRFTALNNELEQTILDAAVSNYEKKYGKIEDFNGRAMPIKVNARDYTNGAYGTDFKFEDISNYGYNGGLLATTIGTVGGELYWDENGVLHYHFKDDYDFDPKIDANYEGFNPYHWARRGSNDYGTTEGSGSTPQIKFDVDIEDRKNRLEKKKKTPSKGKAYVLYYPEYEGNINSANSGLTNWIAKVKGKNKGPVGHVAVITIDPDDKSTRYIEYGRYNSPGRGRFVGYHANGLGNYVRHTIPDKAEGEGDWQYINRIRKSLPHGSKFQAMLIPNVDTSKVWEYIENASNNKDRPKYTANPTNFNPNGALILSVC